MTSLLDCLFYPVHSVCWLVLVPRIQRGAAASLSLLFLYPVHAADWLLLSQAVGCCTTTMITFSFRVHDACWLVLQC